MEHLPDYDNTWCVAAQNDDAGSMRIGDGTSDYDPWFRAAPSERPSWLNEDRREPPITTREAWRRDHEGNRLNEDRREPPITTRAALSGRRFGRIGLNEDRREPPITTLLPGLGLSSPQSAQRGSEGTSDYDNSRPKSSKDQSSQAQRGSEGTSDYDTSQTRRSVASSEAQ